MSPTSPYVSCFMLSLLRLFLFLLFVPICSAPQTAGDIMVGSFLIAKNDNSPWLSPSGDFAFGFRLLSATKSGSGVKGQLFLLSIWYNKIPSRTIVWHAKVKGDRPMPMNSKLELTSSSGIVLTDPQGKEIWKSKYAVGSTVSRATLNDRGNFVILGTKAEKLWQSFDNPTDTLLPGQTLGKIQILSSHRSEGNFSRGKFQLRMQHTGNFGLNTINLPSEYPNEVYYTVGDTSTWSQTQGLVFNEKTVFILRENGEKVVLSKGLENYYQRLTLNFDGVLAHYIHPKSLSSEGSWSILWSKPNDICSAIVQGGVGVCGYNSICTPTADNRPSCSCPEKYKLLDPNDSYGSCVPNFTLSCSKGQQEKPNLGAEEDLYAFTELPNTDWPESDYMRLEPFTEEECKNSCLHDCMCAVAIYWYSNTCWKKRFPLSNGRTVPAFRGKALIKVPKRDLLAPDNPQPPDMEKKKCPKTPALGGSVLLGTFVFITILLIGAICLGFFIIYRKKKPLRETTVDVNLPFLTCKKFW